MKGDQPSTQMSMFDVVDVPTIKKRTDHSALSEWAVLYTATEKGNNSGIRFFMTVNDARAWCESDRSKGKLHGTQWIYLWTTVLNYARHHSGDADAYGRTKFSIDLRKSVDDGSFDGKIAALGLHKIHIDDIASILTPLGVEVLR